jgi:hypothetical protein
LLNKPDCQCEDLREEESETNELQPEKSETEENKSKNLQEN